MESRHRRFILLHCVRRHRWSGGSWSWWVVVTHRHLLIMTDAVLTIQNTFSEPLQFIFTFCCHWLIFWNLLFPLTLLSHSVQITFAL
jgi:hypothetical protein